MKNIVKKLLNPENLTIIMLKPLRTELNDKIKMD